MAAFMRRALGRLPPFITLSFLTTLILISPLGPVTMNMVLFWIPASKPALTFPIRARLRLTLLLIKKERDMSVYLRVATL